jgi:hypothetical protein
MSRGLDESLQSSAWLTQICHGAKQICDFGGSAEERLDCKD